MSDILCIYYSRTGHTRRAVKEIAEALDADNTVNSSVKKHIHLPCFSGRG